MRRLVLAAILGGTALSSMLVASRLPPTLDFILPRRAGWFFFVRTFEALAQPGSRRLFVAGVMLATIGSLGSFIYAVVVSLRGRKWSLQDFFSRGAAVALVLFMTRWSFAVWFEVSQKVWFPFGSMNILEPFLNLLVCSTLAFGAMFLGLRCLSTRPPPVARALLPWTLANAFAALTAFACYDAWRPTPALSAGARHLFVVLTEEEGRPSQMTYDLPVPSDVGRLDAEERGLARAGARRLGTLRALYEARSKLMDEAGLRRALMLGARYGDSLARALLLEYLTHAPASADALGALGALADETAYHIGPSAAARIALAYAHLGDAAQAGIWARRAESGVRGIPAGLIDLSAGGALRPGRISGRFDGAPPLKVGIYRKPDPAAPYLLSATELVSSAEPDDKGRFSFTGLAAGRYYLALAFGRPEKTSGEIRVLGHRGDLLVNAKKSSLDLPVLKIKLAAR